MDVTVLGSSGSYPARGNPGSGYLVQAGDTSILLDAGPGVFMALADRVPPESLDAVAISHIHPDHSSDLIALFAYLYQRFEGSVSIPLYGPVGLAEPMAAFLHAGADHAFHEVIRFQQVGDGDVVDVAGVALRFGATAHSVPTVATRAEVGGRVVVYSADTGPGGSVPELARSADVLIIEATLEGERGAGSYPYHLTAGEAGAVGAAAGAQRVFVTHIPPSLSRATAVLEAAAGFGGAVEAALPGTTVQI